MYPLYKKILVPLDGSEIASQALPSAQDLALQAGAELVLLRVVPDLGREMGLTMKLQLTDLATDRQQALVDDAANYLQGLADDLKFHKIATQCVVEIGEAANRIVDYASANGIDLIVMSTHGRTGLARLAYGSVASKVLAVAACPVFLVRSQQPTSRVQSLQLANLISWPG